jgi:hypothetical protein
MKPNGRTTKAAAKANPRNLTPKENGKVKGGYLVYKLENVRITSYQLG